MFFCVSLVVCVLSPLFHCLNVVSVVVSCVSLCCFVCVLDCVLYVVCLLSVAYLFVCVVSYWIRLLFCLGSLLVGC